MLIQKLQRQVRRYGVTKCLFIDKVWSGLMPLNKGSKVDVYILNSGLAVLVKKPVQENITEDLKKFLSEIKGEFCEKTSNPSPSGPSS